MIILGVDSHKASHTAIENAEGLGHHLAQWLIGRGGTVVDIPPTATAKIRTLSRGGRRKSDPIDAAAAACVAAIRGESRPVAVEDHTGALALLDERRHTLSRHRARLLNQLHALLRELIPGGMNRALTATAAEKALHTVTPATATDQVRTQLVEDLIADVRRCDRQLADNTATMKQVLDEHATSLTDIVGVGPVLAARVLAGTRDPRRFPTAAAYANYTGTAPVQVASGDYNRHRLLATRIEISTLRSTPSPSFRSGPAQVTADAITTARSPRETSRPRNRYRKYKPGTSVSASWKPRIRRLTRRDGERSTDPHWASVQGLRVFRPQLGRGRRSPERAA
ncbi:transposase [Nocardia sp. NPDC051900]|uniref:IS110 family transposase n=1 Tax=Nocardia sp. NPDC051900 TaxID=3364326 RepID=UPI0037A72AF1